MTEFASNNYCFPTYADSLATKSLCSATKIVDNTMNQLLRQHLANIFRGRIEYEYIVYEVRSTEQTIQFIFDETEKGICFIIYRITETKFANHKLLNH